MCGFASSRMTLGMLYIWETFSNVSPANVWWTAKYISFLASSPPSRKKRKEKRGKEEKGKQKTARKKWMGKRPEGRMESESAKWYKCSIHFKTSKDSIDK